MPCGVKGYVRIADTPHFTIGDAFGVDLAQTVLHHRQRGIGGQIVPHAPSGVIRMSVRDQRAVNATPRVDIEITGGAIDALGCEGENRFPAHSPNLGGVARRTSPSWQGC